MNLDNVVSHLGRVPSSSSGQCESTACLLTAMTHHSPDTVWLGACKQSRVKEGVEVKEGECGAGELAH